MIKFTPRFVQPMQRRFSCPPPQHLVWVQERLRSDQSETPEIEEKVAA